MFQTLGVEQSTLNTACGLLLERKGLFLTSKSLTYCISYLFKSSLLIPLLISGHIFTLFTSVKVTRGKVLSEKKAGAAFRKEPWKGVGDVGGVARVLGLEGWKSIDWLMSRTSPNTWVGPPATWLSLPIPATHKHVHFGTDTR